MGTLKGPIQFIGKIGTIHANRNGQSKKSKKTIGDNGGMTKSTFLTGKNTTPTRENAREFAGAGMQGASFNDKLNLIYKESKGSIYHRLVKIFSRIIKLGLGNRGFRLFSLTLWSTMMKGFIIGHKALTSSISAAFTAVLAVGNNMVTITFPTIQPSDLNVPQGATHFRLSAGFFVKSDASADLTDYKYTVLSPNGDFNQAIVTRTAWFSIGTAIVAPTIITAGDVLIPLDVTETALAIGGIEFGQMVNTVVTPLIGSFAASIVAVS